MSELKPKLTGSQKRLLKIKNRENRSRPEFRRQEWFRYKKLGTSWRKPRGKHSKLREHWNRRPPVVDAGFRTPLAVRGLHPSGFKEVRVFNVPDLEKVNPEVEAVRIGSTVGGKKREQIQIRAAEMGIRVLNPVREAQK
ncbi:MAG: 50S ribosomal protein L32e [Thermoplasmataceae archaeon]